MPARVTKAEEVVIAAFQLGRPKKVGAISTDGHTLFSYAMPIAWREPDGRVTVEAVTQAPSVTTKHHIRAVSFLIPHAADARGPHGAGPYQGPRNAVAGRRRNRVGNSHFTADAADFRYIRHEAKDIEHAVRRLEARDARERKHGSGKNRVAGKSDYFLMYGRTGVSHPFALRAAAIAQAETLSRPGSFGGEVSVIQRMGPHTTEIGRARSGRFHTN